MTFQETLKLDDLCCSYNKEDNYYIISRKLDHTSLYKMNVDNNTVVSCDVDFDAVDNKIAVKLFKKYIIKQSLLGTIIPLTDYEPWFAPNGLKRDKKYLRCIMGKSI
jgi:hypothetical protein